MLADRTLSPDPPNLLVSMQLVFGMWLVIFVTTLLFNAAGMLSWRHGLTGASEPAAGNIGWAMAAGATAMVAWYAISTAASMILYIVLLLVGLVVFGIFAASGALQQDFTQSDASTGLAIILVFAVVALYLLIITATYWLKARFSVSGPIMAARRTINPIDSHLQSWKLTKACQWRIVGLYFVELAIVAIVVVAMAVLFVGSMAVAPDTESGKWIALGLSICVLIGCSIPLLLMSVATPVAIFRQIGAGGESGDGFSE